VVKNGRTGLAKWLHTRSEQVNTRVLPDRERKQAQKREKGGGDPLKGQRGWFPAATRRRMGKGGRRGGRERGGGGSGEDKNRRGSKIKACRKATGGRRESSLPKRMRKRGREKGSRFN